MLSILVFLVLGLQVLLLVLLIRGRLFRDQAAQQEKLLQTIRFEQQQERRDLLAALQNQFLTFVQAMQQQSREQREVLADFGRVFEVNVDRFNQVQKEKFQELLFRQERLMAQTEKQLERMRETVDEKLQKTLETRLGQSFALVSEQLQAVQKGLGEMQHLAAGVGDLKKVLSNVKTRGVLGEYQLQALLEQLLAPDQYALNVAVIPGRNVRVEFAVKMPGAAADRPLYLPIDAKFPQESYERLLAAYDGDDLAQVQQARLVLIRTVKTFAATIEKQYLLPPFTTDFALLFLPTEGLYAELAREPGFIQELQQQHRVVLTGPTTLAAFLNSLQMGFKTLAIQQRSSEVWQVLAGVKAEFTKFGGLITKAQKKLQDANQDLDQLVGTRTRAIERKLRDVALLEDENDETLPK
ncbi:MAG: DNA recombination protein RmuC [Nitritalea sp.]